MSEYTYEIDDEYTLDINGEIVHCWIDAELVYDFILAESNFMPMYRAVILDFIRITQDSGFSNDEVLEALNENKQLIQTINRYHLDWGLN